LDCTTSNALPVLDSIAASSIALLALAMLGQGAACDSGGGVCPAYVYGGVILGATSAPLITSAAYGFSRTAGCRDALREQAALEDDQPVRRNLIGTPRVRALPGDTWIWEGGAWRVAD
jgi:hypothetical protein